MAMKANSKKDTLGSLRGRAVLVSLTCGCWGAHAMDADASNEVEVKHGVKVKSMARVWKSLLVNNTKYKAIQSALRAARTFHDKNTFAWEGQDGTGILTTANYSHYMEFMRIKKDEVAKLTEDFLEDMPAAMAEAAGALNSLFKASDYPSIARLRNKFYLGTQVMSIPEGSTFAADLDEEEQQKVRADIDNSVTEAYRAANREMWDRMHSTILRMQEQLTKPKGIKQASVDNIREMLELLHRMNVTGDERLEKLRVEALDRLGDTTAKDLNDSSNKRAKIAADVDKIQSSMAAFMGGIARAA